MKPSIEAIEAKAKSLVDYFPDNTKAVTQAVAYMEWKRDNYAPEKRRALAEQQADRALRTDRYVIGGRDKFIKNTMEDMAAYHDAAVADLQKVEDEGGITAVIDRRDASDMEGIVAFQVELVAAIEARNWDRVREIVRYDQKLSKWTFSECTGIQMSKLRTNKAIVVAIKSLEK